MIQDLLRTEREKRIFQNLLSGTNSGHSRFTHLRPNTHCPHGIEGDSIGNEEVI